MTSYTNDETLHDNHIPSRSREASGVETPHGTGEIDRKESIRWQRQFTHQPDVISTMDGEGQKQSRNQGYKTASFEEERCVQHEENVCQPAKAYSSIYMIHRCRKVE